MIICWKQPFYGIFPGAIGKHSVSKLEKAHRVEDSGVADNDRRGKDYGRKKITEQYSFI